ncbi:protein C2-DOMAIN ABA-RELATED 4-like [Diospyros lotus]|uniref:protein C2-DOMAIN ABA-RELATED 4-like n=1 Tax=Diospyros lotus TaxID=55363 RepID=UPI002259F375|nr:protein C2-DOMAIN ABA-RELATED 4-like [Diospyros lotus]
MENLLGLLRIHVFRGINLAKRDVRSSDPYVVVRMGKQKLRTRVVKKNTNPEWDEDLTLSISSTDPPVKISVYDKDTFSFDDKMGDAEFDIRPFAEAVKMKQEGKLEGFPNGTTIFQVKPTRENCLSEESNIMWTDGKLVQHMFLRLRNVECGEIELQLEWIDVPGSKGFSK